MRLNPALHVLHVEPDLLMIGSGRRRVLLFPCSPGERRFVELLQEGIPDGTELSAACGLGMTPAAAQDLLDRLAPAIVPVALPRRSGHRADALAADTLASWSRSGALTDVPGQRAAATVQVFGLQRTGATLAQLLRTAGVGHVAVWDPGLVSQEDLGTVYLPSDLGRSRAVALARRLDEDDGVLWPLTTPHRPVLGGDLTVVLSRGAVDPQLLAQARARDHVVLPVVTRDDDVLIGPWLDPEMPGCPECWLERQAASGRQPSELGSALLDQEAGREGTAEAVAAAGLAAAQVLAHIDGPASPTALPLVRLLAGGQVQQEEVTPHPSCGCLQSLQHVTAV